MNIDCPLEQKKMMIRSNKTVSIFSQHLRFIAIANSRKFIEIPKKYFGIELSFSRLYYIHTYYPYIQQSSTKTNSKFQKKLISSHRISLNLVANPKSIG